MPCLGLTPEFLNIPIEANVGILKPVIDRSIYRFRRQAERKRIPTNSVRSELVG